MYRVVLPLQMTSTHINTRAHIHVEKHYPVQEGKLSKVTFVFTNFKENHARNYTVEIDNSGLVVKSEFSLTKGI